MKKLLTKFETDVYTAYHPEMGNMTETKIAEQLGVSQATISRTLNSIYKKAPILSLKKATASKTVRFEDWMSDKVKRKF